MEEDYKTSVDLELLERNYDLDSYSSSQDDVIANTVEFPLETDTEKVSIPEEREKWGHKAEFILSLLGYSVGLGNVWRFPYICYKNGGGTFLIPYMTFMFTCGIPLFFMEVSIGQFVSKGAVGMWCIAPLMKGVGYATAVIGMLTTCYYQVLMSYIYVYLWESFTLGPLPWSSCGNSWNTERCTTYSDLIGLKMNKTLTLGNSSLDAIDLLSSNHSSNLNSFNLNSSLNAADLNKSTLSSEQTSKSAAEEFFMRHVLQISSGMNEQGGIVWHLLIALIVAWVVTSLCLMKGVKSVGKVVYVTASFPYVMLFILLIRGLTLPGAVEGIRYYLTPNMTKLLNFNVWGDAAVQVFYSLGPGWGALVTMGSYNKFGNNCYNDGRLIPILMSMTSVLCGFVVFAVTGFLSNLVGKPISEVVVHGPGVAFVMYPEVVNHLPLAPLWAFLFFLMLITIGLDTMFVTIETCCAAIMDELKNCTKYRPYVLIGLSLIMFLGGIPFVFQGGSYTFRVVEVYSSSYALVTISLCQVVVISWIYGGKNFVRDVNFMLGKPAANPRIWQIIWRYCTTLVIAMIMTILIWQYEPLNSYNGYIYPSAETNIFGWSLVVISIICIPIFMIVQLRKSTGTTLKEKFFNSLKPNAEYGPENVEYRGEWLRSCRRSIAENGIPS